MQFVEVAGEKLWADVRSTGQRVSEITGRVLGEYEIGFTAGDDQNVPTDYRAEYVLEGGRRLKVVQSTKTISGGVESWSVLAREVETFNPSTVTIGPLVLSPADYVETVQDGERRIELIARADLVAARQLQSILESRAVVGVSRMDLGDETLHMEISGFKYAEEDEGVYVAVRLESPDSGESTDVPWTADFFGCAHWAAKAARARLRALITVLKDKGVLTEEDLERLDAETDVQVNEVAFEFNGLRKLSDRRLRD